MGTRTHSEMTENGLVIIFEYLQVYDEKEDCWQESIPMKQRRAHLAVAGFNGELFAMGGMGNF